MKLSDVNVGSKVTVKAVSGDEKTKKFLHSLGCSEHQEIALISILSGNYILNIKGSRYALDKKMAETIEVE